MWHNENIFYWIQIHFDWIKIYLGIMKKKWYDEKIFYWVSGHSSSGQLSPGQFPPITFPLGQLSFVFLPPR